MNDEACKWCGDPLMGHSPLDEAYCERQASRWAAMAAVEGSVE